MIISCTRVPCYQVDQIFVRPMSWYILTIWRLWSVLQIWILRYALNNWRDRVHVKIFQVSCQLKNSRLLGMAPLPNKIAGSPHLHSTMTVDPFLLSKTAFRADSTSGIHISVCRRFRVCQPAAVCSSGMAIQRHITTPDGHRVLVVPRAPPALTRIACALRPINELIYFVYSHSGILGITVGIIICHSQIHSRISRTGRQEMGHQFAASMGTYQCL